MLPHLDDYLLSLQTNNYSEKTVYNYERDLNVFERYLDKDAKLDFAKLKRRDIEKYKAYLVSRDRMTAEDEKGLKRLNAYSINRMLSVLRSYLKYMIDSKAGLCHHCNNTKPVDKPEFKRGLYYKAGTNLVIKANPYNL